MTTNRGGRPAVGPMISLRFPTDLTDRLDARAAEVGATRSELLRRAAEQLLAQEASMITATAPGGHRPGIGQRVALFRRIEVSANVGTVEDWHIAPESQATEAPLGQTWGDPAGYSMQVVGWGTGVVRSVYPHRDLPVYVVEPEGMMGP